MAVVAQKGLCEVGLIFVELFAARGKYHFCFIALFVKKILKEKPQTVQFS